MTHPRVGPALCNYPAVNILDSGRSGRLVRLCAEFQSIGLGNRFELVCLDELGDASAWAISRA
jgi:hypothetical protein